jgi:hypothetical protein
MDEKYAGHRVAIESGECGSLAFGHHNKSLQKPDICSQQYQAPDETPFFTYGAEYEVGMLLGDEVGFGNGSMQKSLADKTAASDSNLRLVHIVGRTLQVVALSEKHVDAFALVAFEHVVEYEIDRKYECCTEYQYRYNADIISA